MKTDDILNSAEKGYEGYKKIGSADYLYGWNWKIYDASGNGSPGEGGTGLYLLSQ